MLTRLVIIIPLFLATLLAITFPVIPEKNLKELKIMEEKKSVFIDSNNYREKLVSTENEIKKYIPSRIKNKKSEIISEIISRRIANIRFFLWGYLCLAILAGGRGLIKREDKIRKSEPSTSGKTKVSIASISLFIGIFLCYICSPVPVGAIVAMFAGGGAIYIFSYSVFSQISSRNKNG